MIISANKYLFALIIVFGMISFLISGCIAANDEQFQGFTRQEISQETDEQE